MADGANCFLRAGCHAARMSALTHSVVTQLTLVPVFFIIGLIRKTPTMLYCALFAANVAVDVTGVIPSVIRVSIRGIANLANSPMRDFI